MALETKITEESGGSGSVGVGFNLIQSNSQSNVMAINALIERTGYPLTQENGQRKYGPPPDWANRPVPDRGCEAFIGKIPRDCFEDELVPVLERIGPLYEFRLMMEYSGFNRGYGFVMYTCREHARQCVAELNNYEIRKGKMIGVCRSVDNCRLFVGGIPKNKKREEILDEMRKVTSDVVNVIVYPSAHDKTKNRGFAFVQYSSHRAAAIARRKLIPNRIQIFGQPIAVDWAEPEAEVDDDVMATVKIVYVRNLMIDTTEQAIRDHFEKATKQGAIERVKKVKDFAFVHFKERQDAIDSINKLNGTSIDGSIIELSLSKPADKVNLQKLLRSPNHHLLDYSYLLAQNILPTSSIIPYPILDPNAQLATCDILPTDTQNMNQLTLASAHTLDINQQKILNHSPYFAPTKLSNKSKQYSRFNNLSKINQNGLVIGNVKKQPTNQVNN